MLRGVLQWLFSWSVEPGASMEARYVERVMAAKSNRERQESLRKRRLEQGMTEVRGIYAKPEHHAAIKAYAKRLARQDADTEPARSNEQSPSS